MPNHPNNLPPDENLNFLNDEGRAEMDRWRQKVANEGMGSRRPPLRRPDTMRTLGEKVLTTPIDELIESIKPPPKREQPPGKTNYSRGRGLGARGK